jgi:hypothetical protein
MCFALSLLGLGLAIVIAGCGGRYGDIVLYLAISLKIGLLAHHRGDFAEPALDS